MKSIVKIVPNQSISRNKCELPDGMTGIEYSVQEKAVAFYSNSDGTIGFVSDDQVRLVKRRIEIPNPVGMCCNSFGIAVFQLLPEMLWSFDQSYDRGKRMCGLGTYASMSKYIRDEAKLAIPYGMYRTNHGDVSIALPFSHVVVEISNGNVLAKVGCGKKGFLVSTSPSASMLNSPSGVCFDESSGLLFVSDTGNRIVRSFLGSSEKGMIGMPGVDGTTDGKGVSARLSSPGPIRCNRGSIVFVDGNRVRMFRSSDLDVSTPYISSNKIIDVAMGGDAIYVLEEI